MGKRLMFMLSEIKQDTQLCIQNKYSYVNREETGSGKKGRGGKYTKILTVHGFQR